MMFFNCSASFVAYALLSTFATITERERDAVRFILELIPCYDEATGKLRMTPDAHVLSQIYLAELRVMAGRHSYIHEGSLEEAPQARALLSVIVMPLIRHLCAEEYECLLESMEEAYFLLSRPVDVLDELVIMWRIRNSKIVTDWRSHPTGDLENYEFGVELPDKTLLEDLLAPLPYPTKPKPCSSIVVVHTYDPGELGLAEYGARLIDSDEVTALPRSECVKELELKEKAVKTGSNIFAIPFLGRSRGSSDSRSEHSYSSGSSGLSWISWDELQGPMDDLEGNQSVCAPSHNTERDVQEKVSKRKRLSHYVKMLFRRV
ncbi:hypothetical protein RSOLAG22IIIB_06542 [Rhizoctonia solani]|uniref:Uncharacterized protein n=1 Tax=Rhizoctonia solani TaxID=456999 RepID=A0A0K6GEX0_9AGAM|nr:hypothetical protein RSOLAG22IIIB_06542 [Rhizoctonia solani]